MTQRDSQAKAARSAGSLFEKYGTKYRAGFGTGSRVRFGLGGAAILFAAQVTAGPLGSGQVYAQTPRYQSPVATQPNAPSPQISLPTPTPITPNGVVVEDVIVQVNDQIINRSDLERAQQQLQEDAQRANVPPAELADREKTLLRDLIDQQLLLSRGKELDIKPDAEVIRRLDEVRKQNKLDSMEDLEKAVRAQGISYEDFKANIRNSIITQQVVRDEVGRRLQLTQAAEQAYYDEHKADFAQPEQVRLSEILVPLPENATDDQIAQAQTKADGIAKQIKAGDKFEALAKLVSGGQTASQGGDLGLFKRGSLAKVLEDQTFDLQAGQNTAPIRTRQGFVILKVTEHQGAGTPPLKDIEPQVQEAIYSEQMQPALRAYLTKLREDAYIDIKSGFVDAGASSKQTKPVFSAYAAPQSKKQKKAAKKRFDRGALNASATGPAAVAKPAVIKLDKNGKPKKVKREKIRFGQAPEQSLPPGPTRTATGADTGIGANAATGAETPGASATLAAGPGSEQAAPGQAMAPLESSSNSLSGDPDPLAPKAAPAKKTRYSDRAPEIKLRKEKAKDAKVQEKKIATPVPMSANEAATKQAQAAPLGLNGDTASKKKKKRQKGEAKERLQPKPADPNAPKPDANGNYPTPYHANDKPKTPAGDTTVPPANAPAPGAPQSGETAPATPNTPIPTTPPNQ